MMWEVKNLDSVCLNITDGKHGDCKNEKGSGYYFISSKDVKNGKIIYGNARQITKDDFIDSHRRTKLEVNDILITNSGTIGRMALVKDNPNTSKTTFQKSVAIIKPNSEFIYPKYLYYRVLNDLWKFVNTAGGTAQQNLLLKDLRKIKIPVPPLPTQQKVANILSAYDDLIENNIRRIELLEEAAQQVYKEWFVRFRFPAYEFVHFSKGIPEGWELVKLGELANINGKSIGKKYKHGIINYIDISTVEQGTILGKTSYSIGDAPGRAKRIITDGDILWSMVRPNLRAYALILDPESNDVASTGFAVLTPIKVPFTFLYNTVTADSFVEYLNNHARGSAYPAVVSKDFENAKVLLPSSDILNDYHMHTEPLYRQIQVLYNKNQNLAKQRDLLLLRLMNEKIEG